MKVAYIGHPNHGLTRSTQFIFELLSQTSVDLDIYDDDVFFSGYPGQYPSFQTIFDKQYDLYICLQTERAAILLNEMGLNVVIIPMWDSTRLLSQADWSRLVGVKAIAFSIDCYNLVVRNDIDCFYFQYYPEPDFRDISMRDLRVFFWERLPNSEINAASVIKLLENHTYSLSVHQSPDDPDETPSNLETDSSVRCTTWFDEKKDLVEYMTTCNVYVAPRPFEGIGQSFLDGMSLGLIPIGPNNSTFRDYVSDRSDGIIVDYNLSTRLPAGVLSAAELSALSSNMRLKFETGRKAWEGDEQRFIDAMLCSKKRSNRDKTFNTKIDEYLRANFDV